jgi:hypothetical protein
MELAHHQHPLPDRRLQLLHGCPANVRLHIFGLSPFLISFVIWQGKILNESLLILNVATCLMVCLGTVPLPEASGTGKTGENRSNLKRKAKGIARSLAEVFAYLTFNTSSLNESKKLLSIITNVSLRIKCIISIMDINCIIRLNFVMLIALVIVRSLIFSQRI